METLTALVFLRLAVAAGPLTLDDALALAAKRNAELEVARADEEAATVEARASYQGVLPRLDLTAAIGHEFVGARRDAVPNAAPPPDTLVVSSPSFNRGAHQLGLTLSWTLFNGLSNWNFIAASKTRADAARRQLDESSLRIAFDVTRRYYEVVKQQRALEVLRETEALSSELVKRADALFSAGRGTRGDTYAARVNLGNDHIAARTQTAVLVRARADLATVLGLTTDAGLEVVPPAPVAGGAQPTAQDLPPLGALQASARKNRPLLAAQKLSTEAADLEISRAQGAWWPVLGVQASYQRSANDLGGSSGVFGDLSNQYAMTVQGTLAWNLFAGGETRAGVQRAEAQARRAQAVREQAEQIVAAEVASAREQVLALAGSVATALENVDAAEKGLRFARDRLEAGAGSQLEVRDATLKVTQAKLTLVNTVSDLVVARADLNRAAGGSL